MLLLLLVVVVSHSVNQENPSISQSINRQNVFHQNVSVFVFMFIF